MDERSGTNAHVALACELTFCQSVQFPVENSKEFTGGSFVTKFRQGDEGSDGWIVRFHASRTRHTASRIPEQ